MLTQAELQRIINKSSKAFLDSLNGVVGSKIKSLSPQEMNILNEFNTYVEKPEVYAKYQTGAKDKEIIQDYLKYLCSLKLPFTR